MRTITKVWMATAIILPCAQIAASSLLPRGFALTAVSDIAYALLLLALLIAFALNAVPATGRVRAFWIVQSVGWFIYLIDQLWWMYYDVVLRRALPAGPFDGDVLVFLPSVVMLAGLLLRPHHQQSIRNTRLSALDFLLVMMWWVFFYVFLVSCWQYVSLNDALYNRNYDRLSLVETGVVLVVLGFLLRQSTGVWRRFYAIYLGVVVFNSIAFAAENRAIEFDKYFNGCWYDTPFIASFAAFMMVAIYGRGLKLCRDCPEQDKQRSWITGLAILAVLSLPVMVLAAVLERGVSIQIMHFRVLVTAMAMFAMAALVFMKQQVLHQELTQANSVLQESSTTDPLTGIRNRRFFTATVQRDVAQAVRAYAEGNDLAERDLIFYLIDLDNFKKVNDLYGHDGGDRVLIESARRIASAIRDSDLLVRWGGEEFLVVCRSADRRQAGILAQRVLDAFRAESFLIDAGDRVKQTCSIGWAAFPWFQDDVEGIGHEGVLKFADRALYRAKKAGKNQAVGMVHSDDGAMTSDAAEALADTLPHLDSEGAEELLEFSN